MILLDTHAALWLTYAPEKLSTKAEVRLRLAEEWGEPMAISAMSLWEIAWKHAKGRLALRNSCAEFLEALESRFTVLPIDAHVSLHAARLASGFPSDPMDRLIAGTAIAQDLTLITADRMILEARACKTLW